MYDIYDIQPEEENGVCMDCGYRGPIGDFDDIGECPKCGEPFDWFCMPVDMFIERRLLDW